MESLTSFFERFGARRILWQSYYSSYVLGLDQCVPVAAVLAFDKGLDTEAIEKRTGIRFFSLEGKAGIRQVLDERKIDLVATGWERELELMLGAGGHGSWVVISQNPAPALSGFAARLGIPCSAPDWESLQRFGAKTTLQRVVAELELPRLEGRWLNPRHENYGELSSEFGSKFVMQLDQGSSGDSTAIVEGPEGFVKALERMGGQPVWVTPYAGGVSFNVNGVSTRVGSVVGFPSVQVVGHAELRAKAASHCGNDFTAATQTSSGILESIREQVKRIGDWIAADGFLGLFGLDFVIEESSGKPCAVDLNPRWQGSTSLQSQASMRAGIVPMAAAEMAVRAGVMEEVELLAMEDSFFKEIEGSQVFLKTPAGGPWAPGRGIEPGVYSREMHWLRSALGLAELGGGEEILLNGHNPRSGRPIEGGVRSFRVCSVNRAVDPGTGRLESWAAEAAARIEAAAEWNELAPHAAPATRRV